MEFLSPQKEVSLAFGRKDLWLSVVPAHAGLRDSSHLSLSLLQAILDATGYVLSLIDNENLPPITERPHWQFLYCTSGLDIGNILKKLCCSTLKKKKKKEDVSGVGLWPALSRPKHASLKSFLQNLCPGSGRSPDSVTEKNETEQQHPPSPPPHKDTTCFKTTKK